MKKIINYKKILTTLLALFIGVLPVYSLELDLSVDEEIKKQYNPSKLENDVLPALPKINTPSTAVKTPVQNPAVSVPKTTPTYSTSKPNITKANPKDAIKISKWTKFKVRSNQNISDWQKEGTTISFTSYAPVYKRYVTIPSGTVFKGVIVDSHQPQRTGNGGLVVLRITSMNYNGKSIPLNAKLTKANTKKVFFNNVKGKRQYWNSVGKQIDKGENFYKNTRRTSSKLADNPIGIIICPIPVIVGLVGYTANTAASPVVGLFSKGAHISIPAGSTFEIKLLDDAYIY